MERFSILLQQFPFCTMCGQCFVVSALCFQQSSCVCSYSVRALFRFVFQACTSFDNLSNNMTLLHLYRRPETKRHQLRRHAMLIEGVEPSPGLASGPLSLLIQSLIHTLTDLG